MAAVDKRDGATLLPLIEKHIAPGTTIISNCWKAYCNLEKHGKGTSHEQNRGTLATGKVKTSKFWCVKEHVFVAFSRVFVAI